MPTDAQPAAGHRHLGTYLLSSSGHKGKWSHDGAPGIYPIDFNPTLLVSGLGLLFILVGTLIAVPMNNFHLTRPIGLALIGAYVLIMTLNLLTEVFWGSRPFCIIELAIFSNRMHWIRLPGRLGLSWSVGYGGSGGIAREKN